MNSLSKHPVPEGLVCSLHQVGEVLKEEYQIADVCSSQNGRASYRCTRLSDEAEVWAECLSLSNSIPSERPDLFHETKNELLSSCDHEELPIRDSFELNIQGDTRFYVVRGKARRLRSTKGDPTRDSVNGHRPRLRRCPPGRQCAVYRSGRSRIEVDVPALGFECTTFMALLGTNAVLLVLGTLTYIAGFPNENRLMWMYALLPSLALLTIGNCFFIPLIFGHNSLIIGPVSFRKKTFLELKPKFRDSVNNSNEMREALTALDRLFCRQFEGRTEILDKAKIDFLTDNGGTEPKPLVLLEYTGQQHAIDFNLPRHQQEWLAGEINKVLDYLRRRNPVV